jgi:hypothetical protein
MKRATSKISQVFLQNGLVSKRKCFKTYTSKNCLEAQNIKRFSSGFEPGSSGWKIGKVSTELSQQIINKIYKLFALKGNMDQSYPLA